MLLVTMLHKWTSEKPYYGPEYGREIATSVVAFRPVSWDGECTWAAVTICFLIARLSFTSCGREFILRFSQLERNGDRRLPAEAPLAEGAGRRQSGINGRTRKRENPFYAHAGGAEGELGLLQDELVSTTISNVVLESNSKLSPAGGPRRGRHQKAFKGIARQKVDRQRVTCCGIHENYIRGFTFSIRIVTSRPRDSTPSRSSPHPPALRLCVCVRVWAMWASANCPPSALCPFNQRPRRVNASMPISESNVVRHKSIVALLSLLKITSHDTSISAGFRLRAGRGADVSLKLCMALNSHHFNEPQKPQILAKFRARSADAGRAREFSARRAHKLSLHTSVGRLISDASGRQPVAFVVLDSGDLLPQRATFTSRIE
ncbi:hypothetical protein EVAR_80355_1 [Eumeta japonica]|uniref:Uncharacterized protein n=1 Tax=Eumeta variegata TaxID=151549 RepID=A0A4C1X0W9_EUMVA|nr:hypothetical protein EVAR_80355_1 [Eumeta japonica]